MHRTTFRAAPDAEELLERRNCHGIMYVE